MLKFYEKELPDTLRLVGFQDMKKIVSVKWARSKFVKCVPGWVD
jgi:hypothetical protein